MTAAEREASLDLVAAAIERATRNSNRTSTRAGRTLVVIPHGLSDWPHVTGTGSEVRVNATVNAAEVRGLFRAAAFGRLWIVAEVDE